MMQINHYAPIYVHGLYANTTLTIHILAATLEERSRSDLSNPLYSQSSDSGSARAS